MELETYLGDLKLNPYKFSTGWVKPGTKTVPPKQWELVDIELRLNNNENYGFRSQIDLVFKTEFLKLHKSLHGLSPVSCPNVAYDAFMDNTGACRS